MDVELSTVIGEGCWIRRDFGPPGERQGIDAISTGAANPDDAIHHS